MAAPHIVANVLFEVENALGTPIAVTAVTNANPGVATATSHGLTDGEIVKWSVTSGMKQLDGQVSRVANASANDFDLESVDTTSYATWSAGTATEITSWHSVCNATSLDLGTGTPNEVPTSNFCSVQEEVGFALAAAISGTAELQHDPQNSGQAKFKGAAQSDILGCRYTRNDSSFALFGATTSFSGGSTATLNSVETTTVPLSVKGTIADYAS